jgi:hypothetical protein
MHPRIDGDRLVSPFHGIAFSAFINLPGTSSTVRGVLGPGFLTRPFAARILSFISAINERNSNNNSCNTSTGAAFGLVLFHKLLCLEQRVQSLDLSPDGIYSIP